MRQAWRHRASEEQKRLCSFLYDAAHAEADRPRGRESRRHCGRNSASPERNVYRSPLGAVTITAYWSGTFPEPTADVMKPFRCVWLFSGNTKGVSLEVEGNVPESAVSWFVSFVETELARSSDARGAKRFGAAATAVEAPRVGEVWVFVQSARVSLRIAREVAAVRSASVDLRTRVWIDGKDEKTAKAVSQTVALAEPKREPGDRIETLEVSGRRIECFVRTTTDEKGTATVWIPTRLAYPGIVKLVDASGVTVLALVEYRPPAPQDDARALAERVHLPDVRISLEVAGARLEDALDLVLGKAKVNAKLVFDTDVDRNVPISLSLEDVAAEEAFSMLVRLGGCSCTTPEDGTMRIREKP